MYTYQKHVHYYGFILNLEQKVYFIIVGNDIRPAYIKNAIIKQLVSSSYRVNWAFGTYLGTLYTDQTLISHLNVEIILCQNTTSTLISYSACPMRSTENGMVEFTVGISLCHIVNSVFLLL